MMDFVRRLAPAERSGARRAVPVLAPRFAPAAAASSPDARHLAEGDDGRALPTAAASAAEPPTGSDAAGGFSAKATVGGAAGAVMAAGPIAMPAFSAADTASDAAAPAAPHRRGGVDARSAASAPPPVPTRPERGDAGAGTGPLSADETPTQTTPPAAIRSRAVHGMRAVPAPARPRDAGLAAAGLSAAWLVPPMAWPAGTPPDVARAEPLLSDAAIAAIAARVAPIAHIARPAAAQPDARPVFHVTIDRLDVRIPAATPRPSPTSAAPRARSAAPGSVSLSDYLRGSRS